MDLPLPSPFTEHLQTNYCPSDSEIREIRELIDTPLAAISALDAEIARISEQLKQLQAKRDEYNQYLGKHKSLLSPIRRLPVEILQKILAHCLPTEHDCIMSPHEAPMLLTHVCKQWRELVRGTPLLWSSLYIPIPKYPAITSCVPGIIGYSQRATQDLDEMPLTEEQKAAVNEVLATWDRKIAQRRDIVKEWLERAQGSNLSITLTQWDARREPGPRAHGANPDSATRPEVQEIVALVKSYSKQWKRLEVSAVQSIVDELVSLPAEDVANLEFLSVSSRPVFPTPNMVAQLGGIPAAANLFHKGSAISSPHIKVLSLRAIQQDIASVPTRWENLTGFFFYGYAQCGRPSSSMISFTPSQALDLLALCPNLEQCSLDVGGHPSRTMSSSISSTVTALLDDMNKPRRVVVLPHLEDLFIHEHPVYPLGVFFRCLDMPKLSSFAFSTSISPRKRLDRREGGGDDGILDGFAALPNNQQVLGMMQPVLNPGGSTIHHPSESSLVVFLHNYGHTLKRLEFDYQSQTQENLRRCLELAENVEQLSLNVTTPHLAAGRTGDRLGGMYDRDREYAPAYMGDAFFRELIPKIGGEQQKEATAQVVEGDTAGVGNPGCLCPNLTHFSIKLATAELSEESLLEFVRARRHVKAPRMGVARLKKVKVKFAMDSQKRKTRKKNADAVRKGVAGAGDEKLKLGDAVNRTEGKAEEDALALSITSFIYKKLKRTPPSWDLLDALTKDLEHSSDVDLEGFEAEISFPRSEGRGFMLLPSRMGLDGMWSPKWGLQEEGELSVLGSWSPMSVGYVF